MRIKKMKLKFISSKKMLENNYEVINGENVNNKRLLKDLNKKCISLN